MSDSGVPAYTVGDATLRLVALGLIRKKAKQAMKSKPGSSIPPWPVLSTLTQIISSMPDVYLNLLIGSFMVKVTPCNLFNVNIFVNFCFGQMLWTSYLKSFCLALCSKYSPNGFLVGL